MNRKFSCRLKVRSYEIDAFGHVNHAVYLNYYEQARLEYLEQRGLSFGSLLEDEIAFVIARAEIDYLKPLRVSDEIEVRGEIINWGNTSLTLQQEVVRIPGEELISRARFVAVFLDRRTSQPIPVPQSFYRAFISPLDDKLSPESGFS